MRALYENPNDGSVTHHDTRTISASVAFQMLDDMLGSGQDPIRYEGKETTPTDLAYDLDLFTTLDIGPRASHIRIGFHSHDKGFRKGSTLKQLLEDRIRHTSEPMPVIPPTKAELLEQIDSYLGQILGVSKHAKLAKLEEILEAVQEIAEGPARVNVGLKGKSIE